MERVTYPSQVVQEVLKAHFVRVILDVEEDSDVAPLLKPEAIPVAVVFDKDGKELARKVGVAEPESYAKWLAGTRQ